MNIHGVIKIVKLLLNKKNIIFNDWLEISFIDYLMK